MLGGAEWRYNESMRDPCACEQQKTVDQTGLPTLTPSMYWLRCMNTAKRKGTQTPDGIALAQLPPKTPQGIRER